MCDSYFIKKVGGSNTNQPKSCLLLKLYKFGTRVRKLKDLIIALGAHVFGARVLPSSFKNVTVDGRNPKQPAGMYKTL